MTVQVKALVDVTSHETGGLSVPAGLIGEVVDLIEPPNTITYRCKFQVGETTIYAWLREPSIAFLDGPIGPAKAFLELTSRTAQSIEYPDPPGDYSPLLNDRPVAFAGKVRVTFTDGLEITFASNRNSGDIDLSIGGNITP